MVTRLTRGSYAGPINYFPDEDPDPTVPTTTNPSEGGSPFIPGQYTGGSMTPTSAYSSGSGPATGITNPLTNYNQSRAEYSAVTSQYGLLASGPGGTLAGNYSLGDAYGQTDWISVPGGGSVGVNHNIGYLASIGDTAAWARQTQNNITFQNALLRGDPTLHGVIDSMLNKEQKDNMIDKLFYPTGGGDNRTPYTSTPTSTPADRYLTYGSYVDVNRSSKQFQQPYTGPNMSSGLSITHSDGYRTRTAGGGVAANPAFGNFRSNEKLHLGGAITSPIYSYSAPQTSYFQKRYW